MEGNKFAVHERFYLNGSVRSEVATRVRLEKRIDKRRHGGARSKDDQEASQQYHTDDNRQEPEFFRSLMNDQSSSNEFTH